MGMYLTNPNFNPLKTMVITGQGGVSSTRVSPPATCVCQAWEVWLLLGRWAWCLSLGVSPAVPGDFLSLLWEEHQVLVLLGLGRDFLQDHQPGGGIQGPHILGDTDFITPILHLGGTVSVWFLGEVDYQGLSPQLRITKQAALSSSWSRPPLCQPQPQAPPEQ